MQAKGGWRLPFLGFVSAVEIITLETRACGADAQLENPKTLRTCVRIFPFSERVQIRDKPGNPWQRLWRGSTPGLHDRTVLFPLATAISTGRSRGVYGSVQYCEKENAIATADKMSAAQEQLSRGRFYFRYLRVDAKSRKWGMYVTTCGRSVILPEDGSYPPVQHPPLYQFDWEHGRALDEYQIIFIPEGSGLLEIKKQKIQIQGGNVILLTPGLWHRYRPNPETGWREYWVGFCGPGFKTIFDGDFFAGRHVFRVRESVAILDRFETLIATAQENGPALQQTMAAQTSLLLAQVYASTLVHPPAAKEASKMVQRAREMMFSAETRDLSLEETARRLGTSYSNFRRTFREHTGVGPHQYRLHLKLNHARDLLSNTELSIKEVAFQSGFEEEQYFCRFFKKTMGKTPSSYRKQ